MFVERADGCRCDRAYEGPDHRVPMADSIRRTLPACRIRPLISDVYDPGGSCATAPLTEAAVNDRSDTVASGYVSPGSRVTPVGRLL